MVILNALSDSAELFANGKVGVIPTDTVYGLACSASNEGAVKTLYALKDRQNKPGTLIAASIQQLIELGIKARYLKAVEHLWPNPISIIIPNHELEYIHLGIGGIACRIPKSADLVKLLTETGPLLTSSANQPGQPEAHTIEEAKKYFGDRVDFYVDGGNLSDRKPSTIIRVVDDAIEILRAGAVNIDETGRIT